MARAKCSSAISGSPSQIFAQPLPQRLGALIDDPVEWPDPAEPMMRLRRIRLGFMASWYGIAARCGSAADRALYALMVDKTLQAYAPNGGTGLGLR
jgi:hypothetical protein